MKYQIVRGMNYYGDNKGFIAVNDEIEFQTGDAVVVTREASVTSSGKFRVPKSSAVGIGYLKRDVAGSYETATISAMQFVNSVGKPGIRLFLTTFKASDDTAGEWEGEDK